MQSHLFIGGGKDGLSFPVQEDIIQLPVGVTEKETYHRETLSVGDAAVTIYRHEGITPHQVLERLIKHYAAWCVNQPGGGVERKHEWDNPPQPQGIL